MTANIRQALQQNDLSLDELNDVLRWWAEHHNRVTDDDSLDNATHAVLAILPEIRARRRASRYNRLTRRDGKYIVTDGNHTYIAGSFREAKRVLDQCHAEDLSVDGFIALYCSVL